jgi:hypothetical protein
MEVKRTRNLHQEYPMLLKQPETTFREKPQIMDIKPGEVLTPPTQQPEIKEPEIRYEPGKEKRQPERQRQNSDFWW